MNGADVDAYVALLRAQHRASAYTIWQGRGRKRRLLGRAESKAEARALAHGNAPCAVWATDGDAPVLVTSRRCPKHGPAYTSELRGAWAREQVLADCSILRDLPHGAECPLPPERAKVAARALRTRLWRGEILPVERLDLQVIRGRVRLAVTP